MTEPAVTGVGASRVAAVRRAPVALWAFAAWTSFVWGSRIRNVVADDAATGEDLAMAVGFVVVGVVLAGVAATWRPGDVVRARLVQAVAAGTIGVWVVRVAVISSRDHGVGFKVVHAALGVVSALLAVAAWRAATASSGVEAPEGRAARV